MSYEINDRSVLLEKFIDGYFLGSEYSVKKIVGDAGLRDYFRVNAQNSSYIIMDCPPSYTSIEPFINIARFLAKNNFSAPKIVKSDIENGFLILEDFGSLSVKDLLSSLDKKEFKDIYYLAIDLLVELQKITPLKGLKIYNLDVLSSELNLFTDYYAPYKNNKALSKEEIEEFSQILQSILGKQEPMNNSIVLRDYHVENMMYLQKEDGIKKLGLLDFQDALIGSPIYDLVSILEDARIDVDRDFALDCVQYYASRKKISLEKALVNYHILGAQRNLRILGVFARKYARDSDNTYLQYMPRVVKYLNYDLSHPILEPLKNWLLKIQII